ncbi:phosphatase PAP2 family protein [Helicobacter sp. MIT 01-3238]|uniref:phosphatase PAP2 family protein n=1 Tax=Helicobacter sp. MIT 01-3238 TaxID=398627 RepID=UPI000E1E54F2|nr:phosphatase PAP2 family protein [Helicobacter sp. MIT 01-3238]RDU52747.1 phosphoesterase [Helicobacter sp. MIT 01-3238]
MNKQVSDNFAKVRLWHFALAVGIFALLLGAFNLFGWSEAQAYPHIQKDIFLAINSLYSNAPALAHNLTQLGDASVSLALLLCFALIAPKLWEALISGSLLSLVLCQGLKALYAIPRPARVFGNDAFNIIGEKLMGSNSFPSGHTVTIFTTLFVLLFAFMPHTNKKRCFFAFGIILFGVFVGLSRVGVGCALSLRCVGWGVAWVHLWDFWRACGEQDARFCVARIALWFAYFHAFLCD